MENTDDLNSNNSSELSGDDLLAEAAVLSDPLHEQPDERASSAGETGPTYGGPPPPGAPAARPYMAADRLTRDPFTTFGGVLSGIAHRYGWDIAVTRLAFLALVLFSGGLAIPMYFLAWLVIPRANYWPPVPRERSRFSARDLGFALLFFGVLALLGFGAGNAGGFFVPLALIGGGIWMLTQNPRPQTAPAFAGPAAPVGPQDAPRQPAAPVGGYAQPGLAPQPVPRRSRSRRVVLFGALGSLVLIPVLAIGGLVAFLAVGSSDFDFNDGAVVRESITTVDDIPRTIEAPNGEFDLDLSAVDFSGVDPDEPVELDLFGDGGRIFVLVPEDVAVDVRAETEFFGNVEVFDQLDEGLSPDLTIADPDPQLILNIQNEVGEIEVVRVGS